MNNTDFGTIKKKWHENVLIRHIYPTINNSISFGSSMHKWAASGMQKTDDTILHKRIEICNGCDLWDKSGFRGTGKCTKCGCSTWAKLRIATEKCPENKW